MHFIVRATIPLESGNKMLRGNMQATMDKVLGDLRPEQSFFAVEKGQRTIYFIVDVPDATHLVRIGEPLWLELGADVDLIPTMTAEEFQRAGQMLGDIVPRYS